MRSPLKWHGGKSYLAKQIVALMPPHTHYLEAFAGGLNVLLSKPCEGVSEFVNDLNGELMNFWDTLRDPHKAAEFIRMASMSPLSEQDFDEEQVGYRALGFFIRMRQSRQGLGKDYCTPTRRVRRGMNENVSAWLSAVDGLADVHERLRRVEVWCRPANQAIQDLDSESLLVYCDPPYMHETRSSTGEYGDLEMTKSDHESLLLTLANMRGKFMLSGYHSELYDALASWFGWQVFEFDLPNNASSAKSKERKTECVWANFSDESF